MLGVIRSFVQSQLGRFRRTTGPTIGPVGKRPRYPGEASRLEYQSRYVDFRIQPGMRVLDIGSGGDPFPYATILVERYLEPVFRYETLVTNDKPLVLADIHHLPFPSKSFDFVYSAHVLQNNEDPIQASLEIMRVGKRGYIETPTLGKDALFSWARNIQRWHVVGIGSRLCFFEYSDRQLDGINSRAWRDLVLGNKRTAMQEAFWNNQDIFNVMFPWEESFSVIAFYLDGSMKAFDPSPEATPVPPLAHSGR